MDWKQGSQYSIHIDTKEDARALPKLSDFRSVRNSKCRVFRYLFKRG